MVQFVRCAGLTIVMALCLVTVSGADDPEPTAAEAAASADQGTTANPQVVDAGEKQGSTASEAQADDGDGAADEPGEAADGVSKENDPAEGQSAEQGPAEQEPAEEGDEPSPEDQAFLQDPFTFLQSDMQSATLDLKDGQTTPPADVTQPRILHRMGLLIEQLERQGAGAGQAGRQVNRPAEQSSLMRGPGGQNEMRAPRGDGRDWADLSPKERQKILQSKTDGFPAGYDDILADYFRRVARAQQEDVAPTADAPSDAGAAPAAGEPAATPAPAPAPATGETAN